MDKATILFVLPLIAVLVLGAFLSFYQLTESPPTWLDEGIITQVSRNIASEGVYGIQVAPGIFESASFVTVGFPLTYPLAAVFDVFGMGILQARVVMAFFILSALVFGYYFIKRIADADSALAAVLLVTTFAPLYGHGKNVLGEVPGLAYMLSGFLVLTLISQGRIKITWYVLAGVLLGLSMVTKPIFLLLLPPAIVVGILLTREKKRYLDKNALYGLLGLLAVFFLWLATHFGGGSLGEIALLYSGNPESVPLAELFGKNIARFFTESQPVFFLVLLFVWSASMVVRIKRRDVVLFSEAVAWAFTVLSFLAYLASVGYYRYFFPAQALSLLFLPLSLMIIARARFVALRLPAFMSLGRLKIAVVSACALLAGVGLYVTQFHSWVGGHYGDLHSRNLGAYLTTLSEGGVSVFFYQAPEALLFFESDNYYQYFEVNSEVLIGESQLESISEGVPDYVVVKSDVERSDDIFGEYEFVDKVARFNVLKKKL